MKRATASDFKGGLRAGLQKCFESKNLTETRRLHEILMKAGHDTDIAIGNLLVQTYGKCGRAEDARAAFKRILNPSVFSWTMMIRAYTLNGQSQSALVVFRMMDLNGIKPTIITFTTLLAGFSVGSSFLAQGKALHARIVELGLESDMYMCSVLITMYSKCGCLADARQVFDRRSEKSVIHWTTMIASYAQQGHPEISVELYEKMIAEGVKPDHVTFLTFMDACISLGDLEKVRAVHADILRQGVDVVIVWNAVISMYGKCGLLDDAFSVFQDVGEKNLITWNAMIATYAQQGCPRQALDLYMQMPENLKPSDVTFLSVLTACADLGAITEGKIIHERIVSCGYETNNTVQSGLVNMYGKCGRLSEAVKIFNAMSHRSLLTWSVIISAYSQQGYVDTTLELFRRMLLDGITPDDIAFVSVLFACSHAGLYQEGWENFLSMVGDHGVKPIGEHYSCMLDLLGRSGRLNAAEELINEMPVKADMISWVTLLSACKTHSDMDRARRISHRLDPEDATGYVMLSQISKG